MGLDITVTHDVRRLIDFASESRKQLPFATSLALNDTGFDMRNAFNKSTLSVFNKPTSFTQKAFLTTKSKKRNLIVHVFAKDKENNDAARYLRFGVHGGARPPKGFERYFSGLPNDGTIGPYYLPAKVKVNASGNITKATLRKISGSIISGTSFIGTPKNSTRPPGIYERKKSKLLPKFITTNRKPTYTGRFDLQQIGDKVVSRRFNIHLNKALDRALRTAK